MANAIGILLSVELQINLIPFLCENLIKVVFAYHSSKCIFLWYNSHIGSQYKIIITIIQCLINAQASSDIIPLSISETHLFLQNFLISTFKTLMPILCFLNLISRWIFVLFDCTKGWIKVRNWEEILSIGSLMYYVNHVWLWVLLFSMRV